MKNDVRTRALAATLLLIVLSIAVFLLAVMPGLGVLTQSPPVLSGQNGFMAVVPATSVKAVRAWSETYLVEPTADSDIEFSLFAVVEVIPPAMKSRSGDGPSKSGPTWGPDQAPLIVMQGKFADALQSGDCRGSYIQSEDDPRAEVKVESNIPWAELSIASQEATKSYFTSAFNLGDGSVTPVTQEQEHAAVTMAAEAHYTIVHPLLADYSGNHSTIDTDSFTPDIMTDVKEYEISNALWIELHCTLAGRTMWAYEGDYRELRHPALIVIDSGEAGKSGANLWVERHLTVNEFPLVQYSRSNGASTSVAGHRAFEANSASGVPREGDADGGLRAAAVPSVSVQFRDQREAGLQEGQIAVSGIGASVLATLLIATWRILTLWGLPAEERTKSRGPQA